MRLKTLGCSGGIGGHLRTTSFLLDDDVLIDAGTGVGDLEVAAMAKIDHIFLTHSHLDHATSIPFIVDTTGWMRDKPLTVYAIEPTIKVLREHLFNWKLWPDFTEIPDAHQPFLRYEPVTIGKTVNLDGRKITPIPANHVVPAVGYWLDSGSASLAFTGDTTVHDPLWEAVNKIENLRYLVIETAFCNRERDLAVAAKHLCPSMLTDELKKFKRQAEVYITHLKPGEIETTMQEILESASAWDPQMLENGKIFEL